MLDPSDMTFPTVNRERIATTFAAMHFVRYGPTSEQRGSQLSQSVGYVHHGANSLLRVEYVNGESVVRSQAVCMVASNSLPLVPLLSTLPSFPYYY